MRVRFDDLERNLEAATELAASCYEAYRRAPDHIRRLYNQAFFKRILIWEDVPAEGELTDLFEIIFETAALRHEDGPGTQEEAENTGFSASQGL